jgi:protein-L-isoaspartate O-methyltransferase
MDVSSRYRCASAASVATIPQTLVEQLDVGGEPADTAARKTPQQRVFPQSRGILSGDFSRY